MNVEYKVEPFLPCGRKLCKYIERKESLNNIKEG